MQTGPGLLLLGAFPRRSSGRATHDPYPTTLSPRSAGRKRKTPTPGRGYLTECLAEQTMVGLVRQVPGGLGDAVVVVVDRSGGDDVVDVVEAEAQGAQLLYIGLVAVHRR